MKTRSCIPTSFCRMLALGLAGLVSVAAGAALDPGEEYIQQALKLGVEAPVMAGPRGPESAGPFKRLLIKNAMIMDGAGAPTRGPVTIEVHGERIVALHNGDGSTLDESDAHVIDASGQYVLPGFVDAHVHLGSLNHAYAGRLVNPEYVLKLWLAHGVTTVRDVGATMGLEWTLEHKKLAAEGKISAPRMVVFSMFPEEHESPAAARKWVRSVHKKGADGVKFLGAAPELLAAAIDEAQKLGMRTTMHHAQLNVVRTNVLDSARMGLNSMEHWYGLPEAMFEDRRVQHYPYDYNYNNEQDRFGEAGRLWLQAAPPGSATWNATIEELVALDFTIDPTFTIYEANRDLMRARNAPWHELYTMPFIARAFEADPEIHGSYFFDWTTADEIAWKKNYQRWMQFINDYKNAGGRVTTGSDSGFIYKIYGFGYVRELELLQEAGFHPLEVLKSATLNGAELLDIADQTGSIQIGKKADLVIVNENPLANFKVLYGTGHSQLNLATNRMETTRGIVHTIRDGIVFDAKMLLSQVRQMVADEKSGAGKQ